MVESVLGRFRPTPMTKSRILVADDNPLIRKMLCRMFSIHEVLELCEEAVNGKDAVEKAQLCKPDLIVLDLSMPVMDGLAAAPIILFTQHADIIGDGVKGLGVSRVVSKSEMDKLPNHVVEVLEAA